MIKRRGSLLIWGLVSIVVLLMLSSIPKAKISAGDKALQNDVLQKFAGNWGLSFTTPTSGLGALAGIFQLSVMPSGEAEGSEIVATGNPFFVLEASLSGAFSPQDDGTMIGELTADFHDGSPPFTGRTHCVGMDYDSENGQFREMH